MATFGSRWELTGRTLGAGGQGQVFEARDLQDLAGGPYALKRLQSNARPQAKERFKSEIEAISRVENPHVVRLIAHDVEAERPYYVCELCSGGSLEDLAARFGGKIPPELAFRLFMEVCDGLIAALKVGVTHRDIKPANVLLRGPEGPAVLADWGICYLIDGERVTLTDEAAASRFIGDPLLEEGRVDEETIRSSDVYSLGELLYWMLTGRVIPREDFRSDGKNLVNLLGEVRFEHISRLLDHMITIERNQRYPHVVAAADAAASAFRLVLEGFNVVSKELPQPCKYCGTGTYRLVVSGNSAGVNNFGLSTIAGNDWRILACDYCGNVQLFNLRYVKDPGIWEK